MSVLAFASWGTGLIAADVWVVFTAILGTALLAVIGLVVWFLSKVCLWP